MFDDALLDDETALLRADVRLRHLAERGARVRREALSGAEAAAWAVARLEDWQPRAVLVVGPDARLLRAVLEPVCPVPLVAWHHRGLPAWAGSLDLVVVLAPEGSDPATAGAVAEAARRGCPLVVAAPEGSLVGSHATGRDTTLVPTATGDPLAVAVGLLDLLHRLGMGPDADPDVVADALDAVAVACGPQRDLAVNPAKILAIGVADADPMLWGGTVLAARAARRIADSVRRATGRTALASDAEQLTAVLEATVPADVFADPFADPSVERRPALVLLDDGDDDPLVRETGHRLRELARSRGVRVEQIGAEADGTPGLSPGPVGSPASGVARYAAMLASGGYAATYLQVGSSGA